MSKVGDYMSKTLYTTSPDTLAHEAIDDMYKNKISALLVSGEQDYEWIITKTDWMLLVLKGECDPKTLKVSDLMTKIVNTVDVGQTIAEACAKIQEKKVRHLPATENGRIVGMLSVKDIEKYFLSLHSKTDF
ncbi:MAG: CBS domain-containing protein [Nitrospina sp.]|nr:CBS domain-containing protein [Nitrospina sp.]